MDYTKQIEDLIKNDLDFDQWFLAFPLQEQPEVLRAFKDYAVKMALSNDNYELLSTLENFDLHANHYEDAVITELASKEVYDKAIAKRDKLFEEMDQARVGIREYVIECIVTQADNADAMLELAPKLIELEKDIDFYQAENWSAIAHLL